MSDVEDIAAYAGITIVNSALGDGGDTGSANGANVVPDATGGEEISGAGISPSTVAAMEASFSIRYSMDDPDFALTVNERTLTSNPPTVPDFRPRRPRDDFRGRGERGYGRGRQYDNRPYQNHRDNRSYGERDNRTWQPRDGGDGRYGGDARYRRDY